MTLSLSIRQIVKVLFFVFSVSLAVAQQKPQQTNDFWDHVRFGGGIGLSFGDAYFSGTVAPSAIYQFDSNFALGLGLNATFNKQKNAYKSTILGGSVLGLFNVINELQLSTEFENLHVNRRYDINLNLERDTYWVPALFFGAGYRSGNITFGVRYDVLYDKSKSIYADAWAPFFRVYF